MRERTKSTDRFFAVVIAICILIIFVPAQADAATASDISGHWAGDTIQKWIDEGTVTGYEDGTFRPENNITRAEFMSLANGLFEYTEGSTASFCDVKADAWYAETVSISAAAGYIAGYPDGTIRPDALISREEAASVLMKIMKLKTIETAAAGFTDLADLGWSRGAVGAVYSAGIMSGYPDGSFQGRDPIKRCEALTALDKAAMKQLSLAAETDDVLRYTALGDSIAYGSKVAEGSGYVDLLSNRLRMESDAGRFDAVNLSKPGKNSSALLTDLRTNPATIQAVSNADVITISIGGNNLLKPVMLEIETTFGLDAQSDTFNQELAMMLAVKANRDKLKNILTEVLPELEAGVLQFSRDWPEIIATVKYLSPDAKVLVATVYNPLPSGEAYYDAFDKPIQELNAVIISQSGWYQIADVYEAFGDYNGTEALTNFDLLKGCFDVHPTIKGYEMIYQCHIN